MKKPALKSLSDKELLAQIEKIRRREHLSTIDILLHLNEVECRKLHLKLGYSSLYDYCVRHMRYSSSGATRRVAVARCVRQHPEVIDLLRSRKLNVTGVSLVATVLNADNKKEILESIQDKTQSQIDAIAACYRPSIAFRDQVKLVKVVVPEPKTAARGVSGKAHPAPRTHEKRHFAHNGQNHELTGCTTTANRSESRRDLTTEQKLLIQFLANKGFMKEYEEVRALLSQRLSDTSFESVFGVLIREFLERHSPACREAKREARKTSRPARTEPRRVRATQTEPCPVPASEERLTRHIPASVRDRVFVRDKGRCAYVGRNGKRCGSTQALQIDHIKPFTRGGNNSASNLRLLCAKHNRLAAQEMFGEDVMKRYQRRE